MNGDRVTLRTRAGGSVEAVAREVEIGEEAHAAVRPEKVRFGSHGDNVVSARIKQVVYLGVSTQYIAELPDGRDARPLPAEYPREDRPGEGDEVSVAWDARHCRVLGG